MVSVAVFLTLAWLAGMVMSQTFGGTLHALPFAAALLLLVHFVKKWRAPPPPPHVLKPLKGRTTWSV